MRDLNEESVDLLKTTENYVDWAINFFDGDMTLEEAQNKLVEALAKKGYYVWPKNKEQEEANMKFF